MTDPTKDAFRDPVPLPGRNADRREPMGYTKGFRAMVGKRFGYKSARRAGNVWLGSWQDEPDAGHRTEGQSG